MSGRDPAEIVYLTAVQVLFIHARLLAETGGTPGVRDLGLLESAIARPRATFDGQDPYPDLYAKAAALMVGLVNNHPFADGNKRVGGYRSRTVPNSQWVAAASGQRGTRAGYARSCTRTSDRRPDGNLV